MIIKTKFNPGDKVWIFRNEIPEEVEILNCRITIKKNIPKVSVDYFLNEPLQKEYELFLKFVDDITNEENAHPML